MITGFVQVPASLHPYTPPTHALLPILPWLQDIPALRYVCRINGLTHINLTKLDVLSDLPEILVGGSRLPGRGACWPCSAP